MPTAIPAPDDSAPANGRASKHAPVPPRRGPKAPPQRTKRTSPAARIRRLSNRQHGLISRRQALEAGLSARQIRYRVRSGMWAEPRPDVYAVTGSLEGWEAAVLAVVLSIPEAVASGRTALWLHGVTRLGKPDVIEVTVPFGYHRTLPGVVIRQTRAYERVDITVVGGVPVTTAARTVIDLAGELGLPDRLTVLDDVICLRIGRRKQVHARALALRRGRAGVAIIIAATKPGAEQEFHSWLERHTGAVLRAAGLPQPRWNVALSDRRGRIGIVDAVLGPDDVIVLELDGLRFHSTPAQVRSDRARDRRLVLSGRVPLRYTYDDVMSRPEEVVAEIRQALARTVARGAPQ
jgi:hypothetical protein